MAPESSSGRRKRARPQTDDERISSPDLSDDAVISVKKRRLNSHATPAEPTPKGFSALASAIGGVFGFGRRSSARNSGSDGKTKSVYDDIPGSSDDEAAVDAQMKPKPTPTPRRPAVRQSKLNVKSPKTTQAMKNVYDVPSSGDELEFPTEIDDASKSQDNTPRKTRRADGKSKITTPSRKSTATNTKDGNDQAREAAEEEDPQETPSRNRARRQATSKMDGLDASESRQKKTTKREPAIKASTLRGRPGLKDSSAKQPPPTPKGILTPRHKRAGRPRKSVAFDSEDNKPAAEVFFEDLPSKSKAPAVKSRVTGKTVEPKAQELQDSDEEDEDDEEEEDSEDDEVCAVCSKPDSKPPNEIIFCEKCEIAVHQKCYNVPVIPQDDWFCRDCLQEDVVTEPDETSTSQLKGASKAPDIPNFEQHLQIMQRVLIDRCLGNRHMKLKGQDEAYEKAFQLVEQTVLAGEGNSMMIIGARGCGKTTLVETIVSDLAAENKESFHVVRLNGFLHTDDKLALKDIWRQLGKEMDLEDDLVNKTSNYADTLASLLALLSHPSEITGAEEGVTSKSVIFVIDEFDLFATHARQTLLYNLFDIAQARKAPIAVLGLTTRIDVVESLEKRVKSRFSHRYVHLSLPKSLPAYWDICKQGLLVDDEDMESEGFDTSLGGLDEFRKYWDQKIEVSELLLLPPAVPSLTSLQALRETPAFEDHLEYHFYTTKSVASFLTACALPLSALSTSSLDLKIPSSSPEGTSLEAPDSKLHLLAALSDLDLALLIAAARLDIIAHTDTVNFAMAYDEYSLQMGKQRVQSATSGILALGAGGRVWGRAVAGMAWERLVSLGVLIPAGIGGRSNAAHGGLEGKMWKLDVALDEIPAAVDLPGFLVKWCTQI
ncbi:origin recognition complex subunit 4 C-terminus-domain-containing protein [Xylariales sp. AK1849]|nr:origin recognition complex subunit 4 C-terminus-domain-containing protein [Xylariales sp. AK1849]